MNRSTRPRRGVAALAAAALVPALLSVAPAGPVAAEPGDPGDPSETGEPSGGVARPTGTLGLWAPDEVVAGSYDGRAYTDFGLRLAAGDAPVEIWANRASWDQPITAELRVGDVRTPLAPGTVTSFRGLEDFLTVVVATRRGEPVRTLVRDVCLNNGGERVHPDAPARSPYPWGCPWNPFTVGSVQGLQAGWAVSPMGWEGRAPKLRPGRYRVTSTIAPAWVEALGIDPAESTATSTLVVTEDEPYYRTASRTATASTADAAEPAGREPAADAAGEAVGPLPDLRALPAFGMRISRGGDHLQFSATVWNGGDSPLVVDGFRGADEDAMDGYQYFFDADGQQTGYEQVGSFHWHEARTHHHWHFLDFARYSLLSADRSEAVRSRKESFCLANTDAVDFTAPGADWRPEGTDLHTACGSRGALSLRQVLSAGSGDTYAQFRAGQSFSLRGLPNGRYWISVEGNPDGVLREHDTTNNAELRPVRIGGEPGARTVRWEQVGLVEEEGSPRW